MTDEVPRHLLVTNDFPPKVGGIQNYLWELWRRLPPESVTVYAPPYTDAVGFDAAQAYRIERSPEPVLLPYPWLARRIDALADEVGAEIVVLDPAVPLGAIGPRLRHPYGVVLHGAEVTIPGRLPGSSRVLGRVLRGASLVISAGQYALAEAERCAGMSLPAVVVPPGVDHHTITPATPERRAAARRHLGLDPQDRVVAVVTRLVPRKGVHTLVEAVARLGDRHRDLILLVGGTGRQAKALARLIETEGARARLLGRVSEAEKQQLYDAADVMAMPCNRRWAGLEQEGFGIVFLEGAAAGLAQVAGRSGGAAEAVEHGVTGLIVDDPTDPDAVAEALATLLDDPDRRRAMGRAARRRVEIDFDYQRLADRLGQALGRPVGDRNPNADPDPSARTRPNSPKDGSNE